MGYVKMILLFKQSCDKYNHYSLPFNPAHTQTSPVYLIIIICNNLILGKFHHITMVYRKVLTKIKSTTLDYTSKMENVMKNVDDKVINFEVSRGHLS